MGAHRDPTANAAIRRVDRSREHRTAPQRPRAIVAEFPEVFDGLSELQVRDVALLARSMAGHNTWAITAEHLERARRQIAGERPGRSTRER